MLLLVIEVLLDVPFDFLFERDRVMVFTRKGEIRSDDVTAVIGNIGNDCGALSLLFTIPIDVLFELLTWPLLKRFVTLPLAPVRIRGIVDEFEFV